MRERALSLTYGIFCLFGALQEREEARINKSSIDNYFHEVYNTIQKLLNKIIFTYIRKKVTL